MHNERHEHTTASPRPTFLKGLLFLALIGAVGALLAVFVMSQRSEEGPFVPDAAPSPVVVEVAVVAFTETLTLQERFTGMVVPRRTSQLAAQTGGRIMQLRADVGDRVRTGQILATLDTRALQADLAALQAATVEAEAAHKLALTTVERQNILLEKGRVAQQRVDEAQAQADSAKARIDASKARAAAVSVQIDLAQITAPYSGVITARFADEGAVAAPGQALFELVETGRLEARIGLPAPLADTMVRGETYTLTSDQGDLKARLRAMTGVIDRGQRTVACVFDIVDPRSVAAGAVVRLKLDRAVDERGIWVPVSALSEGERGLWTVYLVRATDGIDRAQKSSVEIVHSEGDRAYVRGGLEDGDRLITGGLQRITPGQPVIPRLVPDAVSASREPAIGSE